MLDFLVRNITEFNLLEGAKVVAGDEGINNKILWVNVMEILDSLDSLQEGELLITTGYELDDEIQFKNIVLKLKEKGVCGMVIQPGYYISKVPEYIIESANRHRFPIIEIPAKLTFSHIMHVLLDNIISKQDIKNDIDAINIKNKVNYIIRNKTDNYIERMLDESFESKIYLLLLSVCSNETQCDSDVLFNSINKLKGTLLNVCKEVQMECNGKKILFSISLNENLEYQDIKFQLLKTLKILAKECQMRFLIGASALNSINDLTYSLESAMECIKFLEENNAIKAICKSSEIELFKLLSKSHVNFDYFKQFSYDTLKVIIEYDTIHNTNYLETLNVYLANECNITNTSNKLFIHRHTLTNRINKIIEICKVDLDSYYSRIQYSIAFFIYNNFIS